MIHDDLSAQSRALADGRVTSAALTDAVLAEIAHRNGRLNAFLHLDADGARAAAAASDARRVAGNSLGPLDGLTLAVKDNIDVSGQPTTAGMATRRGRLAVDDAFVVQRLRAAGMVVLGKLNMHEAALGTTNDNPHVGRAHNPWREGFTPGGSSGGSAAAVAAGLCALALGSDTMGSVRVPAAYCGVVGFKGSYGAVSTRGSVACAYALDHIGPLVRSLRDLALVWPVMAAFDAGCADARRLPQRAATSGRESRSVHLPLAGQGGGEGEGEGEFPRFVAASDVSALGVDAPVAAAYERALVALQARGATVARIPLAGYDFGRARRAGLLIVEADLLHEHAADWRTQKANFSDELTRLLQWAEMQPASAYAAALRIVAAAHIEVQRWWQHGDVMLLPTTPQTAFAFGQPVPANAADLTSMANMAGVPAISLPLPVDRAAGEMPIGLQAIAPHGHDATLLNLDLPGIVAA